MGRNLTRIGIFYDGGFFSRVSNYYKFGHPRAARITIKGLHTFIRNKTAEFEKTSFELCQIVDAHYFRGRFSAQDTRDHNPDKLFSERYFEDVLMGEGVITHFFPIRPGKGEKGTTSAWPWRPTSWPRRGVSTCWRSSPGMGIFCPWCASSGFWGPR